MYKFFEQDILQKQKKYTLTGYFAALFDYIFPADFRIQQRDEFDACHQDDLSAVHYLRQLQDLADTVGDLDDADVVLAFWSRCQLYLRPELTRTGYEPSVLTVNDLKSLATRIERTEEAPRETQKSSSHNRQGQDSDIQTNGAMSPSKTSDDEYEDPQRDPEGSDDERRRINRLREERKCFLCESPDHLARNCSN